MTSKISYFAIFTSKHQGHQISGIVNSQSSPALCKISEYIGHRGLSVCQFVSLSVCQFASLSVCLFAIFFFKSDKVQGQGHHFCENHIMGHNFLTEMVETSGWLQNVPYRIALRRQMFTSRDFKTRALSAWQLRCLIVYATLMISNCL